MSMNKRNRTKKNTFGYGRPHSGLSDPGKYGLTYEEVMELIESGQWRAFYKGWCRGKEGTRCNLCHSLVKAGEYTIVLNVVLCANCVKEIADAARGAIDLKITKGTT